MGEEETKKATDGVANSMRSGLKICCPILGIAILAAVLAAHFFHVSTAKQLAVTLQGFDAEQSRNHADDLILGQRKRFAFQREYSSSVGAETVAFNGKKCPATCPSTVEGSCGRCISMDTIWWMHWQHLHKNLPHPGTVNLYAISNACFDEDGPQFYGKDRDLIVPCGQLCKPMFHPFFHSSPDHQRPWYVEGSREKTYRTKDVGCADAEITHQPALVINWMEANMMYYAIFENIFVTFVTAAHMAKWHDCDAKDIRIYIKEGGVPSEDLKTAPMWNLLFKPALLLSQARGRFKNVYFGQIHSVVQTHIPFGAASGHVTVSDPHFTSWLSAFRVSLRTGLLRSRLLSQQLYAEAFHRTGCPGEPGWWLAHWHSKAPDQVLREMYWFCKANRLGAATDEEKLVCCEGSSSCPPRECKLQGALRPLKSSRRVLYIPHKRAPPWFKELDWNIPGVQIETTKLEALTFQQQMSRIASSDGLLGMGGAGLAQHIFLPTGAFLVYIGLFTAGSASFLRAQGQPENCCLAIDGKEKTPASPEKDENGNEAPPEKEPDISKYLFEDGANSYFQTSVHSGINTVYWRWCREDVRSDSARFTSHQAQAAMKLALSMDAVGDKSSGSRLCMILDPDISTPGWPRCDVDVVVPAYRAHSLEKLKRWRVGLSYQHKKNDSVVQAISSPCRACEMAKCAREPPQMSKFTPRRG